MQLLYSAHCIICHTFCNKYKHISSVFIYFHWYINKVILKQQFIKQINDKFQKN